MKTVFLRWCLLSFWIGAYAMEIVVEKGISSQPAVLTNRQQSKAAAQIIPNQGISTSAAAHLPYQTFRWGLWGAWGNCNVQCGMGEILRQRVCYYYERKRIVERYGVRAGSTGTNSAEMLSGSNYLANRSPANMFYGRQTCIGSNLDSKPCEMLPCLKPVPCLGEWSAYSGCSSTCGSAVRTRSRSCTCINKLGQTDCSLTQESSQCIGLPECEPAVVWSSWLEWSVCSVSCGVGTRERERFCLISDACDQAGYSEKIPCNAGVCIELTPAPLRWGPWASWSECSVTCDSGIRTRTRFCIGSNVCGIDGFSQEEACYLEACPKFDFHGPWTVWTECSVTCGSGLKKRTRQCPGICYGPNFEVEPCDENQCVIPGKYTDWLPYGECRRVLGTEQCFQERTRTCLGPGPCEGPSIESLSCLTGECAPTTTQTTTTRAANQDRCDLRGAEGRVDCGYPGIPRKECLEKGCCFSDVIYDVNWCFYDNGEPSPFIGRSGQVNSGKVNSGGGGPTVMP